MLLHRYILQYQLPSPCPYPPLRPKLTVSNWCIDHNIFPNQWPLFAMNTPSLFSIISLLFLFLSFLRFVPTLFCHYIYCHSTSFAFTCYIRNPNKVQVTCREGSIQATNIPNSVYIWYVHWIRWALCNDFVDISEITSHRIFKLCSLFLRYLYFSN